MVAGKPKNGEGRIWPAQTKVNLCTSLVQLWPRWRVYTWSTYETTGQLTTSLSDAWSVAMENISYAKDKQKQQYDKHAMELPVKVGDGVVVYMPRNIKGWKLLRPFPGPYRVLSDSSKCWSMSSRPSKGRHHIIFFSQTHTPMLAGNSRIQNYACALLPGYILAPPKAHLLPDILIQWISLKKFNTIFLMTYASCLIFWTWSYVELQRIKDNHFCHTKSTV